MSHRKTETDAGQAVRLAQRPRDDNLPAEVGLQDLPSVRLVGKIAVRFIEDQDSVR